VIVLVGFMGAGKTTVGRLLADELGLPFLDSDHVIERREQRSIAEIFATDGEAVFRKVERETVLDLLGRADAVLALGGGAVEDPATRAAVARAITVHLAVSPASVTARVGSDASRPVLARADVAELLDRRLAHYDEAASIRVSTDGRPVDDVVRDVLIEVRRAQGSG